MMRPIILATDLDDTLTGDDVATRRFNEIIAPLQNNGTLKLVYVTGRSLDLFMKLQNEKSLLAPDALITAIGTEIYQNGVMRTDWPEGVASWNRPELLGILTQFTSLVPQPDTEQRDYKISYFLKNDQNTANEIRTVLENYPVDVVYSMDLYLDILPKNVNKGSALLHLAKQWGIDAANIYTCGDSKNDISMLAVGNAIIVGNAKDELLEWARSQVSGVYQAQATYADGILEGLRHYKVL